MTTKSISHVTTYELDRTISLESYGDSSYTSYDEEDYGVHLISGQVVHSSGIRSYLNRLSRTLRWRAFKRSATRRAKRLRKYNFKHFWLRICRLVLAGITLVILLLVVVGLFFPSYTHLPLHYQELKSRVQASPKVSQVNIHNEKIFIAASIYDRDGKLASGQWKENVLDLIHLLGPENVYLSVYENDAGSIGQDAFEQFRDHVTCNNTMVSEAHLAVSNMPHVQLPDGTSRVKRIAYLAEVRNRALQPLTDSTTKFDRILYLNDVVFDPVDAAQLLFSTNLDPLTKRSSYRAACAVDFDNPFKFYDTFATRDLEGYSMGVPFFPWFAAGAGDGSLDDILEGKDAVRVRSCWGGMVAFDARYFQNFNGEATNLETQGSESPMNITAPYKFRAEDDLYWDASECCLIQADIQSTDASDTGIYVNPFVRVAYSSRTLKWLWLTRRFERLYTPIHFIVDFLADLPHFNPRRDERPWEKVEETVYSYDSRNPSDGKFEQVQRIAGHAGFCGRPNNLQLIKENLAEGERNWEFYAPPKQ